MAKSAEARAIDPQEIKDAPEGKPKGESKEASKESGRVELTPGTKIEATTPEGKTVEYTVTSHENGVMVLKSKDGFVVRPDNFGEVREKTGPSLADMQKTYDDGLKSVLKAAKIKDTGKYEQAAAAVRLITLLEASASDNPNDVLAAKVKEIAKMDDDQLKATIDSMPKLVDIFKQAKESGLNLDNATDLREQATADLQLAVAAAEYGKRTSGDSEAATARAEGAVTPEYYPVYEEGPDAVKARLQEIEKEYAALDTKGEKEGLSDAEKIQYAALLTERAKHSIMLPILEKIDGKLDELTKALASIDTKEEGTAGMKIIEAQEEISRDQLRQAQELVLDPTGWANHYTEMIFGEDAGWDEEDSDTQQAAAELTEEFQQKTADLKAVTEMYEGYGFSIDFDADAARAEAKAEIQDTLLEMAEDGSADAVKEFIAMMLGKDTLSDIQRETLQDTLDRLEAPAVEVDVEGEPEPEVEQVTTEQEEDSTAETSDQEDLDAEMEEFLADTSVEASYESSNVTDLDRLAAQEVNTEVDTLMAVKEVFESMVEFFQAAGMEADLEELPASWDAFLKADKKVDKKGIGGWFKRKFGGKSEMQKMMTTIEQKYYDRQADILDLKPDPEADKAMAAMLERAQNRFKVANASIKVTTPWNPAG
jgi:hypothetical protein